MEELGLNNIIAVVIGLVMVVTGCLIAYLFQKRLFNKYRDRVRNAMDKARSEPPVLDNKKV